MKEKTPQAGL